MPHAPRLDWFSVPQIMEEVPLDDLDGDFGTDSIPTWALSPKSDTWLELFCLSCLGFLDNTASDITVNRVLASWPMILFCLLSMHDISLPLQDTCQLLMERHCKTGLFQRGDAV